MRNEIIIESNKEKYCFRVTDIENRRNNTGWCVYFFGQRLFSKNQIKFNKLTRPAITHDLSYILNDDKMKQFLKKESITRIGIYSAQTESEAKEICSLIS